MNDYLSASMVLGWATTGFSGFYLFLKWKYSERWYHIFLYAIGGPFATMGIVAHRRFVRHQR